MAISPRNYHRNEFRPVGTGFDVPDKQHADTVSSTNTCSSVNFTWSGEHVVPWTKACLARSGTRRSRCSQRQKKSSGRNPGVGSRCDWITSRNRPQLIGTPSGRLSCHTRMPLLVNWGGGPQMEAQLRASVTKIEADWVDPQCTVPVVASTCSPNGRIAGVRISRRSGVDCRLGAERPGTCCRRDLSPANPSHCICRVQGRCQFGPLIAWSCSALA
jgi:hypothetical protein